MSTGPVYVRFLKSQFGLARGGKQNTRSEGQAGEAAKEPCESSKKAAEKLSACCKGLGLGPDSGAVRFFFAMHRIAINYLCKEDRRAVRRTARVTSLFRSLTLNRAQTCAIGC